MPEDCSRTGPAILKFLCVVVAIQLIITTAWFIAYKTRYLCPDRICYYEGTQEYGGTTCKTGYYPDPNNHRMCSYDSDITTAFFFEVIIFLLLVLLGPPAIAQSEGNRGRYVLVRVD
jgi:hypothetical protein